MSWHAAAHIRKFGFYYVYEKDRMKAQFMQLFESIFGPYIQTKSDQDDLDRRVQLGRVLDLARDFGMKRIGSLEILEYRWEAREIANSIMTRPALYTLKFEHGEFKAEYITEKSWTFTFPTKPAQPPVSSAV